MADGTCSLPFCDRVGRLKLGLCGMHYQRSKAGRPIEGPPRRVAKIDQGATCGFDGCQDAVRSKGLCHFHWQRQHTGVPLDMPRQPRNPGALCSIRDCEKRSRLHGMCPMHAERVRQHGDPHTVKSIVKGGCSLGGCEREHYGFGYCHLHWKRSKAGQPLDAPLRTRKAGACSEDGCEKHGRYRGLCAMHRDRVKYLADPEPFKAKTARRRQRAAELSLEDRQISDAYRYAILLDPCFYCGSPSEHVDHFYPLAKGGTDHWLNLVRACGDCNRVKWARCGTWFILRKGITSGADGSVPAVA